MEIKKPDSHLIVCSHPYMQKIGLGAMTTGSLFDWWKTTNGDGVYINQSHFFEETPVKTEGSPEYADMMKVFGLDKDDDDLSEWFWYGWKPNPDVPNDGRYVRQNLSQIYGGGNNSDSWTYTSVQGNHTLFSTTYPFFQDNGPLQNSSTLVGDDLDEFEMLSSTLEDYSDRRNATPVIGLPNLNKYMNSLDNWFPRDTWEIDDPSTFGQGDPSVVFANQSLLDDIKSSKGGRSAVSWSGEVTIFVNDGDGFFKSSNCSITEWIPFTMYLYDDENVPAQSNGVALRNSTFVAPKRDVLGKTYSTSEDGGWGEPTGAESNAAADLDLSFNPVTKKWESGTPNLVAKLVTDIPSLANSPEVDRLLESDIKVDLDGEDFANRFVVSSGIAMPIRIQNGNNLQWSPNYLNSEDVRCSNPSDFVKETLTVYNFSTERTFRKDENVMLSRVDGRWIVSQLGIDPSGDPEPPADGGEAGKWGEFTYMMTNSRYLFRGYNTEKVVVEYFPSDMEVDFHRRYYRDRALASNIADNLKEFDIENYVQDDYNAVSGGYDSEVGFVTSSWNQINVDHGYAQTTSFDCLDSKLFGIRGQGSTGQADANAIAATNPTVNSAGKATPVDVSDWTQGSRNGALTAGFFGALFPDGYQNTSDFFKTGDDAEYFNCVGVQHGSWMNGEYISQRPQFTKDLLFSDSDPAGFGDRNNVINPTASDPTVEQEIGNLEWRRLDANTQFPSAASLLYKPSLGQTGLEHIPADVATNAAPSGQNGSPVRTVHRFEQFHSKNDTGLGDRELTYETQAAMIQGEWVAKTGDDFPDPKSLDAISAFDFKPVNPNNIMFRPLKLESYVQFGSRKKARCELSPDGTPNGSETTRQSRVGFEQEIHRTQNDFHRPVAHAFEDREYQFAHEFLYDDENGLKYAGDLNDSERRQYGIKLHRIAYWTRETNVRGAFGNGTDGAFLWAPDGDYVKGGNAFGVITSFTTVNARSSIDFTTDNLYGMGSAMGRSNNQAGNLKRVANHSWGQNTLTNPFRGHNYPDLSVRIYHEHPRNQTLCDPRTMAVHHFNPDPLYIDDKYYYYDIGADQNGFIPLEGRGDISEEGEVIRPRKPRNHKKKSQLGKTNDDGEDDQDTKFWYHQPQISGAVDFTVPSRFARFPFPVDFGNFGNSSGREHTGFAEEATTDNINYSEIVPVLTLVFDDATLEFADDGPLVQPKVMDESFWQINTQRVGKLLPFRWYETVMGIPEVLGGARVSFIKHNSTEEQPANRIVKDLIVGNLDNPTTTVIDGGSSGFVVGDLFGRSANNLILRVNEIGEGGSIEDFKVLDPGIFASNAGNGLTDSVNKGFKGAIVLEKITGNGELEWSFVNTMVYKRERIDPKPLRVKKDGSDIVRIASPKIVPTHANGLIPLEEAQGASFVNEQHEVSFVLDQDNLSENNAYDVFFHFHNDISMTWMSGKRKFFGSDPADANSNPVAEQYISARISTT